MKMEMKKMKRDWDEPSPSKKELFYFFLLRKRGETRREEGRGGTELSCRGGCFFLCERG